VSAGLTPLKDLLALCMLPALAFPQPECSVLEWALGSLQFSSVFFQVHADPAVTTKAMSRILPCSCPAGKLTPILAEV